MADQNAMIEEAYRRDLLPLDKKQAYEEAIKRGIVGPSPTALLPQERPAEQPQKPEQRGIMERLGQGFMDPIYGAAQIGARMPEEGSLGQDTGMADRAASVDEFVRQRETEIGKRSGEGFDWWRAAGQGTNPMLYVPALVGGLAGAAMSGMTAGLLQPATGKTEDFASNKVKDAMLGAAFGYGGGIVSNIAGRAVSPVVGRAAQELLDRGIDLTPGRLAGRMMSRIEDAARSIPWLGEFVRNAQLRSNQGFNIAAINTALDPIGEQLPQTMRAGREAVAYAEGRLSDRYNRVLSQPGAKVGIDQGFTQDMADINRLVGELPATMQDQWTNIIRNRLGDRLRATGSLDGQILKDVESEFGHFARDYRKSSDASERRMGGLFRRVQESIRDALQRQNPQISGELQDINHAYAMFKRIQRASQRRVGAGSEEGVFTPTDLGAAVKGADPTKDKAAYARGDALMQELAEWGQFVLPSKLPDSGTPERTLWILLGLGGAGAHAMVPAITPATIATIGAVAAPYTRPGMRAANAYAQPGAARQATRRGFERAEPFVGASAGSAITKYNNQGNPVEQ